MQALRLELFCSNSFDANPSIQARRRRLFDSNTPTRILRFKPVDASSSAQTLIFEHFDVNFSIQTRRRELFDPSPSTRTLRLNPFAADLFDANPSPHWLRLRPFESSPIRALSSFLIPCYQPAEPRLKVISAPLRGALKRRPTAHPFLSFFPVDHHHQVSLKHSQPF